jgi:hypothetical protein
VVSEVDLVDGEGAQRAEALHTAPRVDHALPIFGRHGEGTHRVEKHIDGEPAPAALGEGIGDILRGPAFLPHVLGIVDALPGRLDDAQLRGKDLVSVQKNLHTIAGDHGGPGIRGEGGGKGCIPDLEGG